RSGSRPHRHSFPTRRSSDLALAGLVDALNDAAGQERWAYAPSPADLPALAEQDVIRTAFIYNPATVELADESVVLTGTDGQDPLDRKSTRLNSSHVSISYAV